MESAEQQRFKVTARHDCVLQHEETGAQAVIWNGLFLVNSLEGLKQHLGVFLRQFNQWLQWFRKGE